MDEKKRPRREKREGSKNKKLWIIAAAVILIAAVGISGYFYARHQKIKKLLSAEGIYAGITIEGVDVAGMSPEEAVQALSGKYKEEIDGQVLTLAYIKQEKAAEGQDQDGDAELQPEGEGTAEAEWEIPFEEIGAGYDVAGAVEKAYRLGREGEEKERFEIGGTLLREGMDIEVEYTCDEEKLQKKLTEVAEEFDQEAKDSEMTRSGGRFQITKEQEGRVMNQAATETAVKQVLETRTSGTARIAAEITEPKITYEDNQNVTDLIGSFSTKYTLNDKNRNTNLEVGCRYINGTVVAPGDVFSANVELGSQTYAGGYRDAGVYVNGKVEKGMAGGVCQITTTLYNAAIYAELEIVERHPHSMTVGYVPLGRDAAIAGTYKDLKIRNNTEYPIYIEAYASNGRLGVNIYGHEVHNSGRSVEFETVYEATIPKPAEIVKEDPEKPEGEREITSKGRTGSKVSVYKKVFENGKQISREKFSSSSYRATADEVTVGTKKPEETAAADQVQTNASETPAVIQ